MKRLMLGLLFAVPCGAQSAAPAEAAASVTRGGLRWTLSVLKTTVARRDEVESVVDNDRMIREAPRLPDGSPEWSRMDPGRYRHQEKRRVGDPLRVKITVTNVGRKNAWINDDILTGRRDFLSAMERSINHKWAPYLIVTDSRGKPLRWEDLYKFEACRTGTAPADPADEEKIRDWRRAGATDADIRARLRAQDDQRYEKEQKRLDDAHPPFYLKPGKSASTGAWVFPGNCGDRPNPPVPAERFAELWNYHLDEPGVYRIRLVIDGGKTAPIRIKVLP